MNFVDGRKEHCLRRGREVSRQVSGFGRAKGNREVRFYRSSQFVPHNLTLHCIITHSS